MGEIAKVKVERNQAERVGSRDFSSKIQKYYIESLHLLTQS